MHFGMELHAEVFSLHIPHRRQRTVTRARQCDESIGEFGDAVAVRHPHFGDRIEHCTFHCRFDLCRTVLALCRRVHLAAEGVGESLHAVADAEDGQTRVEDEFLDVGSVLLVHRFWSAGEDESFGLYREDFLHGRVPREQLAIDLRLAHTPRDDLRILGTEIEDGDRIHIFDPLPQPFSLRERDVRRTG
jgi:hypothetical protein